MQLIDGKLIASQIKEKIREETKTLPRRPGLAVILVGDDPASAVYVRNKKKDCEFCGFEGREFLLPSETTEEELLGIIAGLNKDDTVDGILVQLPLPPQIDEKHVIYAIDPSKDVDAFHPVNVGRMMLGEEGLSPCTPTGILELLKQYDISIEGKDCVVVGRSNIVGKPMAIMMLQRNATVTSCHTFTKNLADITRRAEILIVAAGCRNLITGDMVKDGVAVIDVAMNRDPATGRFTGDVVFDQVSQKASFITPVPGGVGPMTRAILMRNILYAAKQHMK